MEISCLDDYSNFCNFFQDPDPTINLVDASKKRRRNDFSGDDRDGSKTTLKEILATFLLLDEDEKSDQHKWNFESEQQKSVSDSIFKRESQTMSDYFDSSDIEQLRLKRVRTESTQFVAAAAMVSGEAKSAGEAGPQRRLWVKSRSNAWWEQCNHPDFPDEAFRRAFRMRKSTFNMICEELDSAVTKKDTMLRQAIPVRQRVAVCIWRLATGEPLRLVSKRFGLGISTCHKLILEVCAAIKTILMPKFIHWPNDLKMAQIKARFETISGIPNVAGSIYTTHVPIIAPKINVNSYFNKRHTERNQKTSYSITVQGVVDPNGVFTDVCIGWPGSMPDEKVLEKSALYEKASRGVLKDVWIVGNSGYPLMDWVLAPYTHQNLTWTQHTFNGKIDEIQDVAKDAFARLKARWTCLQKRTEVKLQDLPAVLGACCVLHNICEMEGDELDPELKFELFDDEMIPENAVLSTSTWRARDNIAHNLLHRNTASNVFL